MASLALAFDILARDKASRTFKNVGDSAEKAGRKTSNFGSISGKALKAAAVGLAGLGVAAVAGFGKMVSEARESQKIGRLTEAVIKSTGGAAGVTAKQVGDLATAISNKTGADDEAIQSGANLLLTFTNVQNKVGKGNDIFNQATQTITDMSAALGTDTKASAIQLGKALNDPIKGVTALQKVGVSFTKSQKDQIAALVKSGDTLGAQKIILAELGKEFGGAAAAASDPMSRLSVILGNLAEDIGGMLLPYIDKFATFIGDKIVPAISDFFGILQNNDSELDTSLLSPMEKVGVAVLKVKDAIAGFVTDFQKGQGVAGKFRDVLEGVGAVIQKVSGWISEHLTLVKGLVIALGAGLVAFELIAGAVKAYTAVQALLNAVMSANPIGIVIVAIAALTAGLIYAYKNSETFRSYVTTAFSVVKLGALTMARVAVTAFHFLANVFLTVVGGILDGAAKAFGWVPGIGPKLQGAAKEFGKFKDSANAKLDAIENDIDVKINTEQANIALEALHREFINKGWTVTAQANVVMNYSGNGRVTPRAHGGPALAGMPYIVGEREPELFVPRTSGRIYNQRQMAAATVSGPAPVARLHPDDIRALAAALGEATYGGTRAGAGDRARATNLATRAGR